MSTTFRVSPILERHTAVMRARHATHRQPQVGCPDCLFRATGRNLAIRYSAPRG